MSQPLSEEVLQRIAENKAKALAKLAAKRKHDESTQTSDSTDTQKTSNDEEPKVAKRRARWAKPIFEYDLSQMVDTRGGFLVDDEANDDENNKIETKKHVVDINPPRSIDPSQNPKCVECDSQDIDPHFNQIFKINICNTCKDKYPDKYSLITKTEAKEDYLLTDPELRDEELLPHWSKPNPRKSTWNNMMLYVRFMVEEYAFQKWGSPEALDAEYEKREKQKKEKKDKQFKEKLRDLRKRTITSTWEKQRDKAHKHEYGDPVQNPKTGNTTQTCQICGIEIESESF
ncbi:XPA protein C-terminus-domain-containing protein [Umbelopsis sp. PMI_123]|nr:XPA protein C-terminus-domain-containing protein [Umbelopsis sp. PMI_123]